MGLGGVVSSFVGMQGSNKASKQSQLYQWIAMQEAKKALQEGYNDVKGMYNPYIETSQPFYNDYANTVKGDTSAFESSPWGQSYNQYVMDNTINNLQGTAAARGNLQSGNTLKELQTNIQSILSNDYLNRLNDYLSYSGNLGNQALGLTQQLGNLRWQQAGGNASNAYTTLNNIGDTRAAGTMSKYQQLGNAWGGLTDWGMNALTPFGSNGTGQGTFSQTQFNNLTNLIGSLGKAGGGLMAL
jgi:hypothetical protein